MRIDGPGRIQGIGAYKKASGIENNRELNEQKKVDEVQISSEAMSLLKSSDGVSELERTQKLHELKQQVQSGNYYVESSMLAEKLLQYWKHER